jgi:hypothetical protein
LIPCLTKAGKHVIVNFGANKTLKGTTIWILALLSVLSGANVVNAVIMWFNLGPEGTFTPYMLGNFIGAIPVYVYLFVSALLTAVFLGGTSHRIVSELSYDDKINAIDEEVNRLESGLQFQHEILEGVQTRMFMVDESLEHTRKMFSMDLVKQGNALRQSFERSSKSQQKMLDGVQEQVFLIDKRLNNIRMGLKEQRGATKEIIGDFLESLGPQLAMIKKTVERQHREMENAFAQFEQKEKNSMATIMEQKNELAEIRLKLEKLETSIFEPKPLLESQSSVTDVKGIGHGKAAKLKEIGITNVGDFITADSKVVAGGIGSSEMTVEKLQGRAQLSMVPGVKEKHLLLLEGVNVRDRNSLSEQNPIELSRKINTIFEANVAKRKISPADKPTIEEIDSWVKFSRY